MIDIHAIRRDNPLPDVAGNVVALKPSRTEWLGCCPFHAERTPSFTIFAGGERFRCFGCGASGDVFDFVQRYYGVTLSEAARLLCAGNVPKQAMATQPSPLKASRTPEAIALWNRAVPAAGTHAQSYLALRGIQPPFPPDIRFPDSSLRQSGAVALPGCGGARRRGRSDRNPAYLAGGRWGGQGERGQAQTFAGQREGRSDKAGRSGRQRYRDSVRRPRGWAVAAGDGGRTGMGRGGGDVSARNAVSHRCA
ncbi:hypothetical protein GKE62_17890 [Novosphingobium sp. Gsoil 351]|nr:hypothetical protein GKE62_17890 [Novosphingobium sp. Gsoil 351]